MHRKNKNLAHLLTAFIGLFMLVLPAQEQEALIDKGFLILHSTTDYDAALATVHKASTALDLEINLRDYYASETGLQTNVVCDCGILHGYVPRGRWDDGNYLSIEYSNAFKGFAKGYYMVVAASADKKNKAMRQTLKKAKKYYPDAYIKNTTVYLGCMH